jgi:hypothetical protein
MSNASQSWSLGGRCQQISKVHLRVRHSERSPLSPGGLLEPKARRARASIVAALGLLGAIALPEISSMAIAKTLPLPQPRPPQAPVLEVSATSEARPSDCRLRLTLEVAVAPSMAPITGPGDCQANDVVNLEAIILSDRHRVEVTPPAILQCMMAEAVAGWVRQSVAPQVLELGSSLKAVETLTSFDCRGRNGIVGAQISEHGKANALDVHSLRLANGKTVALTDPHAPKEFRDNLRTTACTAFTTVLGPGSDGFHEDHVHIDLLQRRNGYRICQWDVREPGEIASIPFKESVPLPPIRPSPHPAAAK